MGGPKRRNLLKRFSPKASHVPKEMNMKRRPYMLLIVTAVLTVVTFFGCRRAADEPDGLAPLIVNTDAPLLLDEPAEGESSSALPATKAAAENAACFVCHANYSDEFLVARHAAAEVGCTECHGKSYRHRNDENHTTGPDKMFPPETIRPFCQECHPKHEVPDQKIGARKKQRNLEDKQTITCTDCHGAHRLKRRSVQWNKTTGELLKNP